MFGGVLNPPHREALRNTTKKKTKRGKGDIRYFVTNFVWYKVSTWTFCDFGVWVFLTPLAEKRSKMQGTKMRGGDKCGVGWFLVS
jgi:hypothetical protein